MDSFEEGAGGRREGSAPPDRRLMRVLSGETLEVPPIWLMRQAGRFLPEYRAVRTKAPNFLAFCYDPDLAVEVTLQPIRRFGFDASIIFSDILVIPDALGQRVRFVEGEGPRLDPLALADVGQLSLDRLERHLAPVYEAIRRVRADLPPEVTLLGFAGAPWTLATYMTAGRGSPDQAVPRRIAYGDPEGFDRLIALLVEAVSRHLVAQLDAGADAVQIFDSWAGALDQTGFEAWSMAPTAAIVENVRKARPGARIIGFPRGGGAYLGAYAATTGVDAVGLDWSVPFTAARQLPDHVAVQGNLDPMRLVAGGRGLDAAVDRILDAFEDRPFIFNLGHGVTPETPIENVERVVARVRARG